jgi:4-oxalomesaconate tautomerase
MYSSIPCIWMRAGTSKGAYFLAEDLPENPDQRNKLLLRVMGSPDPRQIDGIGGADPLTSKVAIVQPSKREGVDVDYLFLQVFVDKAVVSDAQNCGNILAGIGPFAVERGLVTVTGDQTSVAIYMENTGQTAIELVHTPEGKVQYAGDARIDGVPGSASAIPITFKDTAGSTCGSLLPTGNTMDIFDGVEVTCIDNGMPVVVLAARDFGITGKESREELDQNEPLKTRLESVRLQAGRMMHLGDVTYKSVPKMSLVSEATEGLISTRTFIPHRCHASIGVLGAVSVATACMLLGSPANKIANVPDGNRKIMSVEHPIGEMTVILEMDDEGAVSNCAILRTARKLFEGLVFVD